MSEIKRDFLSRLFIKKQVKKNKEVLQIFVPLNLLFFLAASPASFSSTASLLLLLCFLTFWVERRRLRTTIFPATLHHLTRYTIILKEQERERNERDKTRENCTQCMITSFSVEEKKREGNGEQSKEKRFKKKRPQVKKERVTTFASKRGLLSHPSFFFVSSIIGNEEHNTNSLSLSLSLWLISMQSSSPWLDQTKILVTWNSPWNSSQVPSTGRKRESCGDT